MKYRVALPYKQKTIIYFNEDKQWAFSQKQFNEYVRDRNFYQDSADLRDTVKIQKWEHIFRMQYLEKQVYTILEYES